MNEMTKEHKFQYITEALTLEGFERAGELEIFTKMHGDQKLVVDLTAGKSVYFKKGKDKITQDDDAKTLNRIYNIVLDAEDGKMPTKTQADIVVNSNAKDELTQPASAIEPEIVEPEMEPQDPPVINVDAPEVVEPAQSPNVPHPAPVLPPQPYKTPSFVSSVPKELSIETIKKYINDKATDEEAYVFLQLCQARNLNPFLKEAYLIKYNHTSPASFVVGKDAFMKRAELHGQFDGFEAGIIVECGKNTIDEERVGTFIKQGETLLGGWAKVYRKDRSHHTEISVSLAEFNTGKSSWEKMPATMIRKVALVQALREAFPSELSGMYDSAEMGVEA